MSIAHLLPDFGAAAHPEAELEPLGTEAYESRRLEAFEEGYRAGWDDASKAQAEDEARVRTDLARNLREMSFTYQEAYTQISRSLAPIFERIAEALLPETARATLGRHVADQLTALARSGAEGFAEVTVAPESEPAVAALLEADLPFPVRVRTDPMLGAGQAELGLGPAERSIDLDATIAAVTEAIHAYFQDTLTERRHG
ncbi:MAG: flagellar assembly protein FliH [Rhodobacteraceae bacterium HLUCCA24]|nr:MAG: flagellar assembly protein FliH [Rhodobacteraceae bacterium HLUCCA24]